MTNIADAAPVWLASTRGKSPPAQSRTLRRRLKKLDAAVARVTETDRLFFARFPQRQYRVRLTSRAEIERQELADGAPMTVPPGHRMCTVVRNIAPDYRLCLFVPRPEAADTDLDEAAARELFTRVAEPHREVEARMCEAAGVAEAAAPPHALQSMTPAQRAFVERELPRLTSADECPLCGRPFANNARTTIGITQDGTAALVGECCQAKIKAAWGHGIYLAPPAQGDVDITSLWIDPLRQKHLTSGDRSADSDRRFFERHPQRRHRLRLASQEERRQAAAVADGPMRAGHEHYVAIRNVTPGNRIRTFFSAPAGREVDIDEATARALFEAAAPPHAGELEAQLRKAVRR